MEALLLATLEIDEDGCVYAKTAGDRATFEVLDASKNVVGRSGSSLAIGGGGADSFKDTWTERDCAKSRLWMVGTLGTD